MNEELYKKQLTERIELIQSNHYAVSYPDVVKPEETLLNLIVELLQGKIEFQPAYFKDISLLQLTSYLRYTHAYYSEKKFFELEQTLILFLKNAEANQYMESLNLLVHYHQFKHELLEHMREEEETFIPYILWLGKLTETNIPTYGEWLTKRGLTSLSSFLLEHNHDNFKSHEFRTYVSQLHPSFQSHSVYRIFCEQLDFFCNDLQLHSSIEEAVVIPKAIIAENHLLERIHALSVLN